MCELQQCKLWLKQKQVAGVFWRVGDSALEKRLLNRKNSRTWLPLQGLVRFF